MRFFDRFRKNKTDAAAPSSEPASTAAPSPNPSTAADERSTYAKYMTGQLIALYKQTLHRIQNDRQNLKSVL